MQVRPIPLSADACPATRTAGMMEVCDNMVSHKSSHVARWSLIASAGSGSTHLLLAGGYCSSPSAVRLRPPQAVAISTNAEMTSTTRCKPLRPTPTA
ncbi:hypothetical protein B296_00004506 [Ensete ventricosum]|uniref:Uncharacterized protein n=1 Tax=Ensete ventricosum TaxID=4639 RepID=A0A427B5Y8_ENSVE|nr:hypothetical protein B296_00004506 [Ensete ventricosum]